MGPGVERLRRPVHIEHGIERRHAVIGRERRIGASIQQVLREIEVAVDDGHQERGRPVSRVHLIDVCATLEQRLDRLDIALPGSELERREAPLRADQLVVAELSSDAGYVGFPLRPRGRGLRRLCRCRTLLHLPHVRFSARTGGRGLRSG